MKQRVNTQTQKKIALYLFSARYLSFINRGAIYLFDRFYSALLHAYNNTIYNISSRE